MDVQASDQLGDGCFQQNSDLFKPWRPVATIQGAWRRSFPAPTLRHTFFPSLSGGHGFISRDTQKKSHQIYYKKIALSKLYLTSFLAIFPLSLPESYPICHLLWLVENHRTSFYFLPSNTLTHCMAGLLRKMDSVQHKVLGRQTGRRYSPKEQSPQPKLVAGKRWRAKLLSL